MYEIKDLLFIVIVGVLLFIFDGIWLYLMKDVFSKLIINIQKSPLKIRIIPAVITYLMMTLGLYHFIIKENKSTLEAFLLGLFVYGVYEGTNYAIFEKWTYITAISDFLWGGVLFGITTFIFYMIKVQIKL